MEKIITFLLSILVSIQTVPARILARMSATPPAPTAISTPTPQPEADPPLVETPTMTTPTATESENGSIRVYVQYDGDLEFPANTQGACDYANSSRTVPPCRGGYPGYSIPIYEVNTKKVTMSPKTDAKGWTVIYLPAGKYYYYNGYDGKNNPIFPERNTIYFTVTAGKRTGSYIMVEVDP